MHWGDWSSQSISFTTFDQDFVAVVQSKVIDEAETQEINAENNNRRLAPEHQNKRGRSVVVPGGVGGKAVEREIPSASLRAALRSA
jgi:hypothetical protein